MKIVKQHFFLIFNKKCEKLSDLNEVENRKKGYCSLRIVLSSPSEKSEVPRSSVIDKSSVWKHYACLFIFL